MHIQTDKHISFTVTPTTVHTPFPYAYDRIICIFVLITHWPVSLGLRTNLALHGKAFQSHTYLNYTAEKAIDGNSDAAMDKNSCTQTRSERNPWWRVTFKYLALVKEVTIVNRADCCGKWIDVFILIEVTPTTSDSSF